MRGRCYNSHHISYAFYGGRGIGICREWMDDNATFYEWAIQTGYRAGMQIERERNNEDYSPSNCSWITQDKQKRNCRSNIRLVFNGESMVVAEWSRRTGILATTLARRYRKGWAVEEILGFACRLDSHMSRAMERKRKPL